MQGKKKLGASKRVAAAGQLGQEAKQEISTKLNRQMAEIILQFPIGVSEGPKDGGPKGAFY